MGTITVVILCAACAGSPSTDATPAGSPQSSPSHSAEVGTALDAALVTARDEATVRLVHQVVMAGEEGNITRNYRGVVNLKDRRWKVNLDLDGTSTAPSARVDSAALKVIGDGSTAYLSSTGWPRKARGRWMRVDLSAAAEALQTGVDRTDGLPAAVDALREVSVLGEERTAKGVDVTGVMPLPAAMGVLGLTSDLAKQSVEVDKLTGEATVRVLLTPRRRLSRLILDGSRIETPKSMPGVAAEMVHMTIATVTFSGWGRPTTIEIPEDKDLLTADEL